MKSGSNIFLLPKLVIVGLMIFISTPDQSFALAETESVFPIRSTGPILFDLDISQFDGIGDTTRIEIYYLR